MTEAAPATTTNPAVVSERKTEGTFKILIIFFR